MSTPKKQKSLKKSRPAATTTISQPQVANASIQSTFCSFSPEGDLFAFLSLAIDKHRLRVYDTSTARSIAEYTFESARVTSLAWTKLDLSQIEGPDKQPLTKKRRRKNSNATTESTANSPIRTLILGLSDGVISLFSPSHGRVVRKLSHPSSSTAIVAVLALDTDTPTIWTSGADSAIRIWDVQKNTILKSWKNEERIPYSSMALRPGSIAEDPQVLLAHHSIKLFSASISDSQPKPLVSFTGHASQVKTLEWDVSKSPPQRFCSSAEDDRLVYLWQLPEKETIQGKPLASIPLESPVDNFMLLMEEARHRQTLITLSTSGKVTIFHIPEETVALTEQKIPTLSSHSQISISSKTGVPMTKIVSLSPVAGQEGCIRVARMFNGVQPVFDLVRYLDDVGNFVRDVVLEDINDTASSESAQQVTYSKRYGENASLAVASGAELGQAESRDDEALQEGDLNVDLAELSLGQRLTALSGGDWPLAESDKEDSDNGRKRPAKSDVTLPSSSLTRSLIQALHSSDSRLLETCLAHSDQALISNTVKKLPPQLAVPLVIACADRLGRGPRSANMKGRGGGASSQRGTTLVVWIKTVLAIHGGHLMTVPDLLARLSGLHSALSARLSLQESLLSLSGRLELVLSQMQMRSSAAPAPLTKSVRVSKAGHTEVTTYVEGESGDSENEGEKMDVEEGNISDNGSIEDVELGANSEYGESEELSEEGEETGDDDDDDDMEEPTINGFIDDEAEEYSQEDESESE
ncbi:WD40-repeat-containing domain protein [Amanita muscaria]